jgi:hypothetical protein
MNRFNCRENKQLCDPDRCKAAPLKFCVWILNNFQRCLRINRGFATDLRQTKFQSTPLHTGLKANVRHTWMDECAVRTSWKILKLSSDSGDSGSKKRKWDYGGTCGEVWTSVCMAGVRSQAVDFVCLCVWQESGFGRRKDVFTFNLLYIEV